MSGLNVAQHIAITSSKYALDHVRDFKPFAILFNMKMHTYTDSEIGLVAWALMKVFTHLEQRYHRKLVVKLGISDLLPNKAFSF